MLPGVRVVDPDGRSREVRWSIYAGTPELTAAPAMEASSGSGAVFEVRVDRPLEAILGAGERQRHTHTVEVLQLHVGRTLALDRRRLGGHYLAVLRHDHGRAEDREEEIAIEGAMRLSALAGIVPAGLVATGLLPTGAAVPAAPSGGSAAADATADAAPGLLRLQPDTSARFAFCCCQTSAGGSSPVRRQTDHTPVPAETAAGPRNAEPEPIAPGPGR